jgi:pyruvate kinase
MPQDLKQTDDKKIYPAGGEYAAGFNATLKNWDLEHIDSILQELNDILTDMARMESENSTWIKAACPSYVNSARNLLHYLALRQRDIRGLQRELASMGLSSLGRSEAHVMFSIIAVIKVLEGLSGYDVMTSGKLVPPVDMDGGQALLDRHTKDLLGELPGSRSTYIMVTMPSEAAGDYLLIRDLLGSGMDCMRINCAYDDTRAWELMISNLRRAEAELNKKCRVIMDIAGNKVRTGPIESGPAILKIAPKRDRLGKKIAPARLWLMPMETMVPPVSPMDGSVPVPKKWLSDMDIGDEITFEDARGKQRHMAVVASVGECRIAECDENAYIADDIILTYVSKHAPGENSAAVSGIPHEERFILMKRGDMLILMGDEQPGRPPEYDAEGRILKPATIGITEPGIFNSIRPGEHIWFDDGKIGGVVKYVNKGQAHVEITHARYRGEKLRANKGVNLPDSQLKLPAITLKDIEDLKFIAEHADAVGFSFVSDASDVRELQNKLKEMGGAHLGVILKIETIKAFDHLPGLLLAAMGSPSAGVMIARGDLAVECGYERLAEVQEEILWFSEAAHMPVIWATEVLEKMAKKGTPSRAEITDAAMAARSECVMLNKGPYVVDAVKALDSILQRMQEHQSKKTSMLRELRLAHKFHP